MRRKLLVSSWTLLALALVFTASATAGNGGIAPPGPQSPNASDIRTVYWLLLVVTGAIFVLVEVSLVVFVVRFRSRGRSREVEGPQIRGHHRLELIWTAIPVVILVGIVSFTFYKLGGIDTAPSAEAAGEHLTVRVEGRQFYWRYVYPNGAVSVNEMIVPVGRVVDLDVTAPVNDVIHSWWIPQLGGKIDAIPGRTNHTWFLADHLGTYQGQCAEFCGIQHALMLARVRAVEPGEYDTWVKIRAAAGQDLAQQTFAGACAPCHGDHGQGLIGPPLVGNPVLADRARLFALLATGKGVMPPVGRGWDRRQLNALAAYLKKGGFNSSGG